ncbi:DUF55-domain-containing protein [Aureobasidium subglaciale]|nr:DUF55-domain-containing protein [Aureobasidium subglaciale]
MPPKKRKQLAAPEPEAPSTVTTPRGKIFDTTAAAARPRRNIASTMPPPDPPSAKRTRRADTLSASEITPKKRGRPPKATSATPKSASTATPKSHGVGERQGARLASTPASEEALPVLRRTRVAKSAKPALPPTKSAKPPIKRGGGRPPKASKKKQPTIPDDDAAEDANDDESVGTDYDDPTHDANITEATTIIQADRNYWLMKAEPETRIEKNANGEDVDVKFTIDDLRSRTQPEPWEGIRNAQAQNNMKAMRVGDLAFLYESNCKKPGIVGIMEIVEEASPDVHAFDKNSAYYDPKSNPEKPKWMLVHVAFRRKFSEKFTLKELQKFSQPGGALFDMDLFRQSRLSVSKVSKPQWDFIMNQAEEEDDEMQDFDVFTGAERDGEDMEAEAADGGFEQGLDGGVDEGVDEPLDEDLDEDTNIEGLSNTDLGNDFAAAFEAPANLRTATDESASDPAANEIPNVVDQMSAYAMAPPARDVSRDVSRGRSRRGRGRPASVPVNHPELLHDVNVPAKHADDAPSA